MISILWINGENVSSITTKPNGIAKIISLLINLISTKKRLLDKMLPFYVEIEDYTKCQHIKDLMDMLERPNENSNKKTKPSV